MKTRRASFLASVLASFIACTSVPEIVDIPNDGGKVECIDVHSCDDNDPCKLTACVRGSCSYAAVSSIECETNEGETGECQYGKCIAVHSCVVASDCSKRECTDRACIDGVCRYSSWKHDGLPCFDGNPGVCSSGECRAD